MKNIFIINDEFYNLTENRIQIGGIYTYIENLVHLFQENLYNVSILQMSNSDFKLTIRNLEIIGFDKNNISVNEVYKNYYNEHSQSIFILATDQLNIKTFGNKTITIQHGVAFDKPKYLEKNIFFRNEYFSILLKILRNFKNISRFKKSDNLICVDYNYYNWLKINYNVLNYNKLHFIPNFTNNIYNIKQIDEKFSNRKVKKILFARRFVEYRGLLIFSEAIDYLISKYDIEITFAGDGPLKSFLIEKYQYYNNVKITNYESFDSLNFHYQYDIAVVPTLYSEGTSLSLLEAMSAGCLTISTFVGGLSNIVIDQFNGLLTKPTKSDLVSALELALNFDDEKFNKIALNGYNTVLLGFNIEIWKSKWLNIINTINC